MKPESANVLAEVITESEVYEKYSGRGMYGKTTTGVVLPSLIRALTALGEHLEFLIEDDELYDALELARAMSDITGWDSMGEDKIIIY